MASLTESIAPDRFEVVSTFPIASSHREWCLDRDTALAIARQWLESPRIHCVQVTAVGTTGTPLDRGFALRNFERVNGAVTDSGWRCWLPGGEFIGAVD